MTPKGSMNVQTFVKWLSHFAEYKTPGRALLIFDGASSHLDPNIVHAANSYDITLFCLPSNTTHELQPMDKNLFKSYEVHWDNEVMLLWTQHACSSTKNVEQASADRRIRRSQFGKLFSRGWAKSATPANVSAGFKATGIYPFDPSVIPDEAFAPSQLTHRPEDNMVEVTHELQKQTDDPNQDKVARKHSENFELKQNSSKPTSKKPRKEKQELSDSDSSIGNAFSIHDTTSDDLVITDSETDVIPSATSPTLSDILHKPEAPKNKSVKPRKKAVNYRAQKVVLSLFQPKTQIGSTEDSRFKRNIAGKELKPQKSTAGNHPKKQDRKKITWDRKKQESVPFEVRPGTSWLQATKQFKDSWYCHLCNVNRIGDMRLCNRCMRYVHEDCEGITSKHKVPNFMCSFCQGSD
ncbi:uncharacterized protein LOC134529931 [Bacillus rossius redtenbacheri]|uniref:uncharacterized protein LOC134529931 n=1 Tax=Bacillus rossius redtenbacheri TaxID=93214 RepID=UPI002FDEE444